MTIAKRAARAGRRPRLEDSLALLREVARDPSSDAGRERLGAALADRSAHVVARAAGIVAESRVAALDPALVAAFDRWIDEGAEGDPGCRAKLALVEALDANEHLQPEPFLRGARCEQPEWTGEDTAVGVRGRCFFALARLRHAQFPSLLVDRLATSRSAPEWTNVARAIAYRGDPAGAPMLRLMLGLVHARLIDEGDEAKVSCLTGYLELDPTEGLSLARARLFDGGPGWSEVVAYALAESRTGAALGLLREWIETDSASLDRRLGYQAIGLMRSDEATAYLLATIGSGPAPDASHAIAALAPFRHQAELVRRARQAAAGNQGADLGSALARAFKDEA